MSSIVLRTITNRGKKIGISLDGPFSGFVGTSDLRVSEPVGDPPIFIIYLKSADTFRFLDYKPLHEEALRCAYDKALRSAQEYIQKVDYSTPLELFDLTDFKVSDSLDSALL